MLLTFVNFCSNFTMILLRVIPNGCHSNNCWFSLHFLPCNTSYQPSPPFSNLKKWLTLAMNWTKLTKFSKHHELVIFGLIDRCKFDFKNFKFSEGLSSLLFGFYPFLYITCRVSSQSYKARQVNDPLLKVSTIFRYFKSTILFGTIRSLAMI